MSLKHFPKLNTFFKVFSWSGFIVGITACLSSFLLFALIKSCELMSVWKMAPSFPQDKFHFCRGCGHQEAWRTGGGLFKESVSSLKLYTLWICIRAHITGECVQDFHSTNKGGNSHCLKVNDLKTETWRSGMGCEGRDSRSIWRILSSPGY